jgi:formylglycine-generating enzyme required for sulfatase activity
MKQTPLHDQDYARRTWPTAPTAIALAFGLAGLAAACGNGNGPSQPAARGKPAGDAPASVGIAASRVTTGVASGPLRATTSVGAFAISSTPTTVGEFKKCIDAGVCTAPALASAGPCAHQGADGATFSADGAWDADALTCVSASAAAQYCQWVGGSLPSVSEWMLAARGPDMHRFAWGDSLPTCAQHRRTTFFQSDAQACCDQGCEAPSAMAVGHRAAGSSPFGVSDVLLAPAELVHGDPGAMSCTNAARTCLVTGIVPGAIDYLLPLPEDTSSLGTGAQTSFRCVWEGGSR